MSSPSRGIPRTGTETFGGTIVTAGGLVFIAGTKDERFHAFDKQTGKLLWEHSLPAGGYATPATYQVNGRQYVVIAAGAPASWKRGPATHSWRSLCKKNAEWKKAPVECTIACSCSKVNPVRGSHGRAHPGRPLDPG